MDATASGSNPAADRLLALGASPSLVDATGATALHHAAASGFSQLCASMLAVSAEPLTLLDRHDQRQTSSLMIAAANGHIDTVRMLLERGAPVDAVDDEGRTALSLAAARGHHEVVKLLLNKGMDEMHKGEIILKVLLFYASIFLF